MAYTDNYPDDWRTWSTTDPRSPLYEGDDEEEPEEEEDLDD